jgi:hypothetical protein
MAEQKNPYAAPSAPVADFHPPEDRGTFIKEGQVVPAGRGWDWWRRGFAIFRAAPWMWALIILVLAGVFLVVGAVAGALSVAIMRSPAAVFLLVGLAVIAMNIVYPIFSGGLMIAARAADEGDRPTVGHVFAGFNQAGGTLAAVGVLLLVGYIVIGAIQFLLFGMGLPQGMAGNPATMLQQSALASLVSLALSIPLVMGFWFASSLVVFNGLSAIDAIRASFLGCLKNIVPFLIYGLVGLGFGIVLALVLGVLVVATRGLAVILMIVVMFSIVPIILGSIYAGYRDIYTTQRS